MVVDAVDVVVEEVGAEVVVVLVVFVGALVGVVEVVVVDVPSVGALPLAWPLKAVEEISTLPVSMAGLMPPSSMAISASVTPQVLFSLTQ